MVSLPPLAIKSQKELIGRGWLQGEWDGERAGHFFLVRKEEKTEKEKGRGEALVSV